MEEAVVVLVLGGEARRPGQAGMGESHVAGTEDEAI